VATPAQELKPEWKRLLTLLNEAHSERFHARRRQVLEKVRREALGPGPDGPNVFDQVVDRTLAALSLIPPGGAASRWTWDQARTELVGQLAASQMTELDCFREQLASPGIIPRRFTWADVLAVLEFAQRKIAKVPDPVARKEVWRNLDAFADARAQGLDLGRWATFGRRPAAKQTEPPEPNLGFAIRSPLLGLSEGVRTLTLTLGFAADGFDRDSFLKGLTFEGLGTPSTEDLLNANLVVRVSGAKGWVPLGITTAALSENTSDYWTFTGVIKPQATPPPTRPALQLVLTAGVSDDPFLAPQG